MQGKAVLGLGGPRRDIPGRRERYEVGVGAGASDSLFFPAAGEAHSLGWVRRGRSGQIVGPSVHRGSGKGPRGERRLLAPDLLPFTSQERRGLPWPLCPSARPRPALTYLSKEVGSACGMASSGQAFARWSRPVPLAWLLEFVRFSWSPSPSQVGSGDDFVTLFVRCFCGEESESTADEWLPQLQGVP